MTRRLCAWCRREMERYEGDPRRSEPPYEMCANGCMRESVDPEHDDAELP